MKKLIRKSLLFGLGALTLTKEKVEDFIKELEKEGGLSKAEGKKLVKDVLKYTKKQQDAVSKITRNQMKFVLKEIPLATKDDLKSVEKKLTKSVTKLRKTKKSSKRKR